MTMHYPHPDHPRKPSVLFIYCNYSSRFKRPWSHVGLGVNAMCSVRVLRKYGVHAEVVAAWPYQSIHKILRERPRVTHCVVEAVWVPTHYLQYLCRAFPNIDFSSRSHSQIAYLYVEPNAIVLLREYMGLRDAQVNFCPAANSNRLAQYLRREYNGQVLYLPNMYDQDRQARKVPAIPHAHRTLRIGAFGSLRPLKNFTTACAAAQLIARMRGSDLEFYVNVGRRETNVSDVVLRSLHAMIDGMPGQKLVEVPWADWSAFRQTIAHMDLLMQPSFTESFNVVSADAVSENVPVVASEAIDWLPPSFLAPVDDPQAMADVGNNLLSNPYAVQDGVAALARFSIEAAGIWLEYLGVTPTPCAGQGRSPAYAAGLDPGR